MLKKRISLILSFTICFVFANAQVANEYLAAADKYFAKGDYYSAAQYYEKHLVPGKTKNVQAAYNPYSVSATANKKITVTSTSKDKVIYNLAECYRKLHFYEKAVPYYQQATGFSKTSFPLAMFHYATTLRALGKYDSAAIAFKSFKQEYPLKDMYATTADMEIENLAFISSQMARKSLGAYKVEKSALNATEGGSYAPVWMNDKTLWFTSTRPEGNDPNKNNSNRIYEADYSSGNAGTVSLTNIPQPKDMQQGVISATPDGNNLFLTRWNIAKSKKTGAIYISKKVNGNWAEPTLVTGLNTAESNTQQPFVMPDGKSILFSSDRNGGFGGFDIWMATLDANGNTGAPVNMGSKINTAFDEQAPSYHAASNTFVFSSNGRVGMGGYDFFYCKGSLENLSEPRNFGYPVNSAKDDLYFTSKGPARNILEDVILSSDREAACCLELFSLSRLKPLKQISGLVLTCNDNQPMANVKVVVLDTISNKVITETTTDASGKYSFTVEEFLPLKALASDSGYFKNSVKFTGPDDVEEEKYSSPDLCLTLIPKPDEGVKVDNVYYDFNKASLQKTSFASLDKLVILLNENPALQIELNSHTDSKGEDAYNQRLSEARAKTVVKYLISKGINKTRLVAKGYGETVPVADNSNPDGTDNPEGRQQNRRTEFKVLKN
jgi:outer membrane protein OmpA-like peptidoglycan-associated protein